jgi:aspartate racemase
MTDGQAFETTGLSRFEALRSARKSRTLDWRYQMKTLGLIGGMSWESTALYYRLINETVKERLGGLHSAQLVLHSVDFHDIEVLQRSGQWDQAGLLLARAGRALVTAGAEALVLCTNTMHKVADAIERAVNVPLLHIADPTAAAIKAAGLSRVGLLGTGFTMEQDFYKERMRSLGVDCFVPAAADRQVVHRVIYEELCLGSVREESRAQYRRIIRDLQRDGAQAVILGCTEICMLIGADDADVPMFDTTRIHATTAAEWAVGQGVAAAA